MEWIFNGIGTALISAIVGLVVGGAAGYKLGLKANIKQKQHAGNYSTQSQIGNIVENGNK